MKTMTWSKEEFQDAAIHIAPKLLGQYLIHCTKTAEYIGKIVETEAYGGFYKGAADDGSHAFRGRTLRNAPMFEAGGISYVYLIYGMYHCFNVVTSAKDDAQAVLIRAVEPVGGIEAMLHNRRREKMNPVVTNGPGKLCAAMEISRQENGLPLWGDSLYIAGSPYGERFSIGTGPRIHIEYAEKGKFFPWRFFIKGNPFVSKG